MDNMKIKNAQNKIVWYKETKLVGEIKISKQIGS
jgi:hypothetical protein